MAIKKDPNSPDLTDKNWGIAGFAILFIPLVYLKILYDGTFHQANFLSDIAGSFLSDIVRGGPLSFLLSLDNYLEPKTIQDFLYNQKVFMMESFIFLVFAFFIVSLISISFSWRWTHLLNKSPAGNSRYRRFFPHYNFNATLYLSGRQVLELSVLASLTILAFYIVKIQAFGNISKHSLILYQDYRLWLYILGLVSLYFIFHIAEILIIQCYRGNLRLGAGPEAPRSILLSDFCFVVFLLYAGLFPNLTIPFILYCMISTRCK
ncbi:hypothetical protein C4J81_09305 [Deltaproteobacteria bacterium Smac51]|nr:hypothetical protein C4J81_09305 [Deltaproteobacteria bacterium Smac51]